MTETLIQAFDSLYAAVVADVLDTLGHRQQTLSADIRALTPANRVCGRVFTAQARAVDAIPEEPYKLEMQAIDTMQAGDVLVVDGAHHRHASFWGELLSTACLAKGVRGVVMSACSRDLWSLNRMPFPVFGIGCTPADSLGRLDVMEIGGPIAIDGVAMATGDFVLGDADGVVLIPHQVIEDTLRLALEKVRGEDAVREELAAGISVAEVFGKHGIL